MHYTAQLSAYLYNSKPAARTPKWSDIRRVTTLQGFARVHLQRKQNMFFLTIMRNVNDTLNTYAK